MRFYNRQRTKNMRQSNSWHSKYEDQYSSSQSQHSKSATIHSGPDRSATSHLDIKLPPMMTAKSPTKPREAVTSTVEHKNITIGGLHDDPQIENIKPKIRPFSLKAQNIRKSGESS